MLVHGYPESSYMWSNAASALADAGWRALAPDLPGYGDSEPDPPGTWERHVASLERFVRALGLGPVALVMHDWGELSIFDQAGHFIWDDEPERAVGALVEFLERRTDTSSRAATGRDLVS